MKSKLLIPFFLTLSAVLMIVSLVSAGTNADILDPNVVSGAACIGSKATYSFHITNAGTVANSFSISYSGEWPSEGPSTTAALVPGASQDIQVSVYIPWTVEPGEHDALTLTVVGGGFSETATATTTAKFIEGWDDVANTPRGVSFSSVVYSAGNLYKIGGFNVGAKPWVDIYNTSTNVWIQGADMPGARLYIDCEAISGKIYCGGGGYPTNIESTLYIYDISSNTWSTGPAIPNGYGVTNYASVTLNDKYYLIGGVNSDGPTNTVLVFDPANSLWDTTLAPLSTPRRMHSAGVIDGKIYVAGGFDGSNILDTAEVYDPATNTWSSITPMPSPWVNAADGVNNDRYLILAGGSPNSTSSSSFKAMIYDAVTETWSWLPDMDRAIFAAEGDSDGSHFWFASGQIFITSWTASPFTVSMDSCATTCPSPVSGLDFSWSPPDPWTGYTVELTATTTSGSPVINFAWDFDDGSTGTGINTEHIFNTAETYTVELTASNCDGASVATNIHDIIVLDPPEVASIPSGLDATLLPDQITTKQLQLFNNGGAPLNWQMTEVDTTPLHVTDELPWLSESITDGVIPAKSSILIDINFSSDGLIEGIYLGNLRVVSDDPVNPTMDIPVSLTVSSSAIQLTKTVGLVDNACGTTDLLNVYQDTIVYYCYTVTNTGGTLLELHTLTDDQLGELLNSYNYQLFPGASFSVLWSGVLITESITNQATWFAEYGDQNATDEDMATVTVIPDPEIWIYLPMILKVPAR